jgi:hypothetical protein
LRINACRRGWFVRRAANLIGRAVVISPHRPMIDFRATFVPRPEPDDDD